MEHKTKIPPYHDNEAREGKKRRGAGSHRTQADERSPAVTWLVVTCGSSSDVGRKRMCSYSFVQSGVRTKNGPGGKSWLLSAFPKNNPASSDPRDRKRRR